MKKLMYALLSVVIMYLLLSFALWSFNISIWDSSYRFLLLFLPFVYSAVLVYMMVDKLYVVSHNTLLELFKEMNDYTERKETLIKETEQGNREITNQEAKLHDSTWEDKAEELIKSLK